MQKLDVLVNIDDAKLEVAPIAGYEVPIEFHKRQSLDGEYYAAVWVEEDGYERLTSCGMDSFDELCAKLADLPNHYPDMKKVIVLEKMPKPPQDTEEG